MIFVTIALITFSFPKYYIFVFFNFFVSNIKNIKNIKNITKKENIIIIIECLLIYVANYYVLLSYNINFYLTHGFPLLFSTFYFLISKDKKLLKIKNYILILRIMTFSVLLHIIFIFLFNIIIEFPILRNGLLLPNKFLWTYILYGFYKIPITELILEKVGISYLYYNLYLSVFLISNLIIIDKSKHILLKIILILILIIGTSYGSRSFVIFYFLSILTIILLKRNFINLLFLILSILIIWLQVNFNNPSFRNIYLKLFNMDQQKINGINQEIMKNPNELNYFLTDIESFKDFTERTKHEEMKEFISSRIEVIYGFYALITLHHGQQFENFFINKFPDGYFVKQKYFSNDYLNFFYLGNYLSFFIFLYLNIKFIYNVYFNYKKKNKNLIFFSLIYSFFFFQYVFSIDNFYLTDKASFLIFLLFINFSKIKKI
jgi:hypothetical protein